MKKVNDINGWLVIDKPVGISSAQVVGRLKYVLHPSKIGHAGTLDPLASGVLPIALGKATRTIEFVMDGMKEYEFEVSWGSQTTTDDAEGMVCATSNHRPTQADILAVLPRFMGQIEQMPPAYSALKVNGQRAYDLARTGQAVSLKPRPVLIEKLALLDVGDDERGLEKSRFRVRCSKGTYVRSLGRDLGLALGCYGFISVLRRTKCEPFSVSQALVLDAVTPDCLSIIPMERALEKVPALLVDEISARRLCQGQRLNLRTIGLVAPVQNGIVRVLLNNRVIGLALLEKGVLHPHKMFECV